MASSSSSVLSDLRRVVTAHDAGGAAVIQTDAAIPSQTIGDFEGFRVGTIWASTPIPCKDNNLPEDGVSRYVGNGLVVPNGSGFRYTDLGPGGITPMHRTSSVDYNVLVQGELTLILEDGTETHLKNPGDVIIQKGTNHAWRNPCKSWTRWVSVIIDAEPATVGGEPLADILPMVRVIWEV
ncbi:hypothetical protein NEOLEDRAFT_1082599 [Neolentinus lepideus HHB14362 ss-1]|uniref:Cupin 2 conserved barrel domain-containing protein n=1 Tax=Neolentinus lepideus HHB14362 ss-1 TaxID=1314782 RepID=A0A165W1U9_9AGAM|nr:hypothetical protein NEOLEDRAFT_1082599 [Neolentinus lepideus HHB14362 ss-1]